MTATAPEIAGRLGLRKYPRSWRGDCPSCAYVGVFAVKAGRYQPLAFCANGCSRASLDDALNRVLAGAWKPPAPEEDHDKRAARARKQAAAGRLWSGSEPAAGTWADTYLQSRGLPGLATSEALRFRPDAGHPEGGRYPAMIAAVTSFEGELIGTHRTYLSLAGVAKANVEPARASLGPIWTGAIRLSPSAPEIVVGEGIESSASAGRLLGLPAWAALSCGNLAAGLVLPSEIRSIVIAADNDAVAHNGRRAGLEAADAAAKRWRAEGRRVRIALPDEVGRDFNDVLKAQVVDA